MDCHTLFLLFLFAHHALAGSQLPLCFVAFWYALVISSSVQPSFSNILCSWKNGRFSSFAVIATCSPYCSLAVPVTVKLNLLRSGFLNVIGDVYSCIMLLSHTAKTNWLHYTRTGDKASLLVICNLLRLLY